MTRPPTAFWKPTPELQGYGLTFTLGRGTELCVLAIQFLARFVEGRTLTSITENFAALTRE